MRKVFTNTPISGPFLLSPDDTRHVMTVLRHRVGDTLAVTDSTGQTFSCRITASDGRQATLEPIELLEARQERQGEVILAAGLLKNDKFEWVVQKATELGVSRVVPVQMAHCVVKLNDARRKDRCARWQKIAAEAAKQCGRNDIPQIGDVVSFEGLVRDYGDKPFLIPYERETRPLRDVCASVQTGDVVICIGPEGGFAPEEIALAEARLAACATVSLGPRILRAETAALAALSIIMYERGFT